MLIYRLIEWIEYCGKEETPRIWVFVDREKMLDFYHKRQGRDFEGKRVWWTATLFDTDDQAGDGSLYPYFYGIPEEVA